MQSIFCCPLITRDYVLCKDAGLKDGIAIGEMNVYLFIKVGIIQKIEQIINFCIGNALGACCNKS